MSFRATRAAIIAALMLTRSVAADESPVRECSGPLVAPPGGPTVAAHLASSIDEQRRVVADLREAMLTDGLDDMPASCAAFLRTCLTGISDHLGQTVAQGYLTGRTELSDEAANQGILMALGLWCLGAWAPGP